MNVAHLIDEFKELLEKENKQANLFQLKSQFLGKKGKLSTFSDQLKSAAPEERKELGKSINELKGKLENLFNERLEKLVEEEILQQLQKKKIDYSYRKKNKIPDSEMPGTHVVSEVQREIESIFSRMGFMILDGPHVEDEFHNFEALNIPANHPARDMQDTFWFGDKKHLLRTHTSTVQVRGMKMQEPPFRFVGPGKVFRCERTDASHEMVFHQLEGMMVDKDLSVANLIYFMKVLLKEIFQREVEVRLRPGYFPFVEPGFELDMKCLLCSGTGCSFCKQVGWVEVLPCGMVHPEVLRQGGIDPEIYKGLAFGLGLDRLVMLRYGINDVRLIHSGDLRFLRQFGQ